MMTTKEGIVNESLPLYMEIEYIENEQQHRNEMFQLAMRMERVEAELRRSKNEQRNMSAQMATIVDTLSEHETWFKCQADINEFHAKEIQELRDNDLLHQSWFEEEQKKWDNVFEGIALLKQKQQKLWETIDPESHRSAPTDKAVEREKRPCPVCGRLLSAKYLRKGNHQKSKRCQKAAADAAAAAALFDQACDSPFVISDVRTMDGDILHCNEYEIPGDFQIEME